MTEGSTGIPGTPGKGSWLTLAACCIRTGQSCASPLLNPSRRLLPAHDNKLQSDPNLGWMVPGLQHDISHAGASRCLQLADSWNASVTRRDNRLFERPITSSLGRLDMCAFAQRMLRMTSCTSNGETTAAQILQGPQSAK